MAKKIIPTHYLKLPFQFDIQKLFGDLEIALSKHWVPHFNTGGYEGEWNSIALYARGGDEKNIYALDNKEEPLLPTPVMKECAYFQEVLGHFHCDLLTVRLLKLKIGAHIKPHRDYQLGYEDNNFRLHIPIVTNPNVDFRLAGERLVMEPGECWYTNVNQVHSVANRGTADRVHLVFDGLRNDWSDELFFALAPKESFFMQEEEEMDQATLVRMIEELEKMDGEGAQELVRQYRGRLEN